MRHMLSSLLNVLTKGVTIEGSQADERRYLLATMMVKMGDADGLVSGACHSTANTLRPALQIIRPLLFISLFLHSLS